MNFIIHRGASVIGGSCVELWTESTRIVIDLGLPLLNSDKTPFDAAAYRKLNRQELLENGILPNIPGLYEEDGKVHLLISHAHQDHYGLIKHLHPDCPVYLGEPTHMLICITDTFLGVNLQIPHPNFFYTQEPFMIGDIEVTPYLMDHSAYDSHAFLFKAGGKSLFYSGDFRAHGRKSWALSELGNSFRGSVDYLLLEGTTIGRVEQSAKSELELESDFINLFRNNKGIHLVNTSGQNIDRLITLYAACTKTNKTLLVDFYTAHVLTKLAEFSNKIPHPSSSFRSLKVFYPTNLTNIISQRRMDLVTLFKPYIVSKPDIDAVSEDTVMIVRPNMIKDLKYLHCLEGGTFTLSMWNGYRNETSMRKFIKYLEDNGMTTVEVHTSGHADYQALWRMIKMLKPKHLVPIHTNAAESYKDNFQNVNVTMVNDGECVSI